MDRKKIMVSIFDNSRIYLINRFNYGRYYTAKPSTIWPSLWKNEEINAEEAEIKRVGAYWGDQGAFFGQLGPGSK